jgi:hypothetical protein
MKGQVLIGVAALIFIITLLLLVALPKRTIGPTVAIENYTTAKREVEHILRNAAKKPHTPQPHPGGDTKQHGKPTAR